MDSDSSPLGLAEIVTLQPGDPRWDAPANSLEGYQRQRRMPLAARNWIMQRFMRRL